MRKPLHINKTVRKPLTAIIVIAVLAAILTGSYAVYHFFNPSENQKMLFNSQAASSKTNPQVTSKAAESSSVPAVPVKKDVTVSFVAAGDNLIHAVVYRDAKTNAGGYGYDFKPMYALVKPEIMKNDFAFINQETLLCGGVLPLSTYPAFSSPTEVGDAVIDAGFNLINNANNHSLDKGYKGIQAASAYWNSKSGLIMDGIYTSQADHNRIRILEKKGVKMALVSDTWYTNGISIPKNEPWCTETNFNDVLNKVKEARKMADVVLVSMHWGNEYHTDVCNDQKIQARKLAEAGADIIIGNHPHSIQNLEWITTKDKRKVIVAYALGNFISGQDKFGTMIGGILEMKITKSDGKITLGSAVFKPVVTYYEPGYKNFRICPLSQYTGAMASKHFLTQKGVDMSPSHIEKFVNSVISPEFLEQ